MDLAVRSTLSPCHFIASGGLFYLAGHFIALAHLSPCNHQADWRVEYDYLIRLKASTLFYRFFYGRNFIKGLPNSS